jgi:hypothetical protein
VADKIKHWPITIGNKKSFLVLLLFLCWQQNITAQTKKIQAQKTTTNITVNGILNDAAWQPITTTNDFVITAPNFGETPKNKTEVKITYDNEAVYVGAFLHENKKNIRTQFTERDKIDRQDVDFFAVSFDTYRDLQNAFQFRVTAANVQSDARISNGGSNTDLSWDAVWESAVKIYDSGWCVEIKIPFSALRFATSASQNWGVNFLRNQRSINYNNSWSLVNPNLSGEVNQWGLWEGLKDIKPPLRLSFLPYLATAIKSTPLANGTRTNETLPSGGMDVKYGINESFTVDVTLIPDFAQVQSDNVFLNTSPFEIRFEDFRPFFTEGTELFNKAGLFYSRRIGGAPSGTNSILRKYGNDTNYTIIKNPGITKLLNATKLSGRTKNNLGIGVFNAVTKNMEATVYNKPTNTNTTITTEPLTNYNIFVLDQAFKNRSYITLTNTNVLRKGNSRNANVGAIDAVFYDKKNQYSFSNSFRLSTIWGKDENYNGFKYNTSFAKVSGKFQFSGYANIESDNYDPNDLGFLFNNNGIDYGAQLAYIINQPNKKYLFQNYRVSVNSSHLYKPYKWTATEVNATAFLLFKNFWDIRINASTQPFWTNDYFINNSNYNGRFLKRTPYYYLGLNGSTDSRKKLYASFNIGGAESPLPSDPFWQTNAQLRYRLNNRLQATINYSAEEDRGSWGWAFKNNPDGTPIIARRNEKESTLILSGQYSFTARMNFTFRLRHYWSYLENTNFYNLKEDGYWTERPFIDNANTNFNTFNIDMFYTWDFLYGSRLTLGWKNALGSFVNLDPYRFTNYGKNIKQVIESPQSREFSIKVVYFLDYLKLKPKK